MPSLTRQQEKRSQWHLIASACWGSLSGAMVHDSSIIILFATLLGAGEMISVCTTSLQDLSNCLLLMPLAYWVERVGKRRMIILSTWTGAVLLSLTAAAPWFGSGAKIVLIGSLALYAISNCAYTASWFPLLDGIVHEDERGRFFGIMRFTWQVVAGLFIFISGCWVGKDAPIGALQIIIAVAGLALLGRGWHVNCVCEIPVERMLNFKEMVRDIVANRPLTGFSIYLFFLYAAASATGPVLFVFAKTQLALPDNLVVIMSACAMGGLIVGFLAGGFFVQRYGVKRVFFLAHLSFALINFLLLLVTSNSWVCVAFMIFLITAYGFAFACASIAVSSEMLGLAPANNKAMSIAFCLSLYCAGQGASRFLASLILGSGILSPTWGGMGLTLTKYHTLFLFFGSGVLTAAILLMLVPAFVKDVRRLPEF
ncbi:MAG: MFS transporter [Verrucomicrobiae bacterium]|nr:MFS transporter [Verrucomicrobiae bacterium]